MPCSLPPFKRADSYRGRQSFSGPKASGFSLIELLMVLAIMGIVSALALPSYTQYVQRGHRAEAAAALLEAQHFMERHYSAFGRYNTPAQGLPVLPVRLQNVPASASARYQLSVATATVNAYQLQGQPVGSMAGDRCGVLTLSHTGVKGQDPAESAETCWK